MHTLSVSIFFSAILFSVVFHLINFVKLLQYFIVVVWKIRFEMIRFNLISYTPLTKT